MVDDEVMVDDIDTQSAPPPPQPAATPAGGFEFNRPTIVSLLYIASCIVGITGIIGLVLAYVWRSEPHEPWEETHYIYLIRTFWFGFGVAFLGVLTLIIGIGFLIMLAAGVWVLVRTIMSLVKAQKREAMPDPRTLLI